VSEEPGAPAPRAAAPLSRREREKREGTVSRGRRGRGGLGIFLLAGALPAAGVIWFFLQPVSRQEELLSRFPAGWGGRAAHAGIAFGVLVVLARVALPAFHGAAGALRRAQAWLATKRGFTRVLLSPLEALVHLLALLARALYAIDAALILACCLVLLLLVARIMKPDFLPSILPALGR
jgi:hypothetical protein